MRRKQKKRFVADFRERLEGAGAVYLTDFTGLDVKAMTALRRQLKQNGATYLVVKNRLLMRALPDDQRDGLLPHLTGPTGIVLSNGGVAEAARAVSDFAKDHDNKPVFKAGLLEGTILDSDKIARIATLPSREVLLSEVAGTLSGPLSSLVAALESKTQELAGLIDALRDKET